MDALSLKTPLWCSQIRVRLSAPWRNCNKRCNRKRYETLFFCSSQNCSIKVLSRAYLDGGKCTDKYAYVIFQSDPKPRHKRLGREETAL